MIVTVALKGATALGRNERLIEVLPPGATVSGRLIGAREKYWLEMAMLLIVTAAAPEFVTVADKVLLLPAVTLPKSSVDADSESVPDGWWSADPPTLSPWQPASKVSAAKRSITSAILEECLDGIGLAASEW